mgnify:CR=1 FL=1
MNREDAIEVLKESKRQNEVMRDNPSVFWKSDQMACGIKNAVKRIAAIDLALAALRPVSREQVEKVCRGEWTEEPYNTISERNRIIHCKKCICSVCNKSNGRKKENFCPPLWRSHDGRGRGDGDAEIGGDFR